MRFDTLYEKVYTLPDSTSKYIKVGKNERRVMFWEAETQMKDNRQSLIRWVSRGFKLASTEWDDRTLRWFIDDLSDLVEAWKTEIDKRAGQATTRERITQLREVTGRTEAEKEIFLAKADELERKLDG